MAKTKFMSSTQLVTLISVSILSAFFPTPALSLTAEAGKSIELSGDFSVSGGQAAYTLPISVSPGRAGHQPDLSLEYRSDSPNGMLGMGWSLGGLSSVYRCGRNLSKDGKWGGVRFDSDDRYCLDGKRLIAIIGKDGENLTEYRVEHNGYDKIVSFGRAGNGPASFKVWRKDGSVYQYGTTANSRVELSTQREVYKWALSKITDASKANYVDFVYSEDNREGKHKLSAINYVGGKVKLGYETRQDRTSKYLGGQLLNRTERLKQIETFDSRGKKIGQYNLSYILSSSTSRSLLAQVDYCASGQCSSALHFKWNQGKIGISPHDRKYRPSVFDSSSSQRRSSILAFEEVDFFDSNRDGQFEPYGMLKKTPTATICNRSSSKVVSQGIAKGLKSETINNVGTYALSGSLDSPSFVAKSYNYIKGSKCGTTPGMSDNVDISLFSYNLDKKSSLKTYVPNKNGVMKTYQSVHSAGDLNGDGKETLFLSPKGNSSPITGVSDIDGDGQDDYHVSSGGSILFYLSTKAHKAYQLNLHKRSNNTSYFTTDVNGDGYRDLIYLSHNNRVYIYLFNGHSFLHKFTSPVLNKDDADISKIRAIDYNSDGYPEVYINGRFYKNHFGLIDLETTIGPKIDDIVKSGDYNSDGVLDFVQKGDDDKLYLLKSKAYPTDKISIIEELANEYHVGYSVAANASLHKQKPYYRFPYVNSTPRAYLVSKVVQKPKGYGSTSFTYQYEGAKSHYLGGGFLGFEKIIETEFADVTTRTESVFEQLDLATVGKPKLVSIFKNNKKVSEVSYSYKKLTKQGHGAKYYQVYANKVVNKTYDLKSSVMQRQEAINRTLDGFGNVVNETSVISSGVKGAGTFTSSRKLDYLSTGVTNHYVYDVAKVSNVSNIKALFSSFKAGLGRYCAANGDVYFKANDNVVLIHGEIDIPLVLQRYNAYFKYRVAATNKDSSGLKVYSGELSKVSAATFNAAKPKACGYVSTKDFDGDGSLELTSSNLNHGQFIHDAGDNFWKVGAVASSTSTLTDNTTRLKRTTNNVFHYTGRGFLDSTTATSSDYESTAGIDTGGKSITNRYRYDQWGNVIEQSVEGTDLAARTSTTQYDPQGLYVTSTANALGHRSSTQFNEQGLLKKAVSALRGRTSSFGYDAFGRVTSESLPGLGNVNKTQYRLGAQCGEHTTSTTVSCITTKPASGGQVTTFFDYAGREVRKLHTGFSGQLVVVDTRWDRNGRKVSVTRPQFVGSKTAAPVVTFIYDDLNREITKREPASNGGIAKFVTSYQGYKTSVTDARGYEHSTLTNVMGHILRKDEPHGAYQTYQYYPDGKLRASTDSAGNRTQVRYDNLGHRSYLDDPDMGKWSYIYNAAGELIEKRDAKGTLTTIQYDRLGRKTKQTENGRVSTWRYDERGALGTLSGFAGNGSETNYYYNAAGLTEEVAVKVNKEKFSTHYFYDNFERVAREVRPNGVDTTLAGAAKQLNKKNSEDKLAVEYVYNPYGYVSAVRSPRTYADQAFTSTSFREDIKQLLDEAIAQAQVYLNKAERHSTQEHFFANKAAEYNRKTVNVHNLDRSSQALLGNGHRYKQWCNAQGECYLRPATWVLLHDEVAIPLDITLEGAIYRLSTSLAQSSKKGTRNYNASVHRVSQAEFASQTLKPAHDFILTDYDSNGQKDLMSNKDLYIAKADSATTTELLFAADDLSQAASIAGSRYKFYTDLASQLISLSEKVAELSGLYCDFANQLGGNQLAANQRRNCKNTQQSSQADHLNLILTQSQLADSVGNPAYTYYWQRRETDAYDHTLSETLGNGLVNTYSHDARTGRPNYIATHKASQLFDPRLSGSTRKGRNVRLIHYRYDNHNNVTYRYDEQLGITDTWEYDGLDRVTNNRIALANKAQHGLNNPDLAGPFSYQYDKLGNLMFKTGIGDYVYSNQHAGPHAVTKANGLNYQYDANGNMLRAWATGAKGSERELEWSDFNKPTKISRNGKTVEFFYDANHNRYLKKNSDGVETFYFGKSYERVTDTATGVVQHKHFIYADGKLIALNSQTDDGKQALKDKQTRYLHYDALNSVDMITDGYGVVVERRSYDTWGKQRKVAWREDGPLDVVQQAITNRGYTGHEEIVEVGLVHMNGRVYDQELGRFISPDPIVQAPYVTNSFNRYAYVWNNPLKYIDPTGFWTVEETDVDTGHTSTVDMPDDIGPSQTVNNGSDDHESDDHGANKTRSGDSGQVVHSTWTWGNEDLAGETDPVKRDEQLAENLNDVFGVEDIQKAAQEVLNPNTSFLEKSVAIVGGVAKSKLPKPADKVIDNIADSVTKGGAHGKVKGIPGNESHHMPADSVSPLSKNKGPAVSMDKADHRQTASWGNSKEARTYRQQQKELIEKGDFRGAQQMDINDVQSKFGSRYDSGIKQMQDYTDTLEL
ncbi:RHS repeat-associated core domain-containing protein [Vibrio cyclitrophicus]|uniref:RHS repeat-associated core domain-containing protein n=1 Tax=Vibrio cyclitrophicus TaxID=47951 RepID=UPI00030A0EF4|nr:RHS repeat-associated core domain-containing protein [Vibrio cyclitrophicus]